MFKKIIFLTLSIAALALFSDSIQADALNKSYQNNNFNTFGSLDEEVEAKLIKKYDLDAPTNIGTPATVFLGFDFGFDFGFSYSNKASKKTPSSDNVAKQNFQSKPVNLPKEIELLPYKGIRVDDKEVLLDETSTVIKDKFEEIPDIIKYHDSTSTYSYKYFDVFFDENGKCMEIQVVAYPQVKIEFKDHHLNDLESYAAIESVFKEYDDNMDYDSTGFTSEKIGINVFCEHLEESTLNPIDAYLIFKKNDTNN